MILGKDNYNEELPDHYDNCDWFIFAFPHRLSVPGEQKNRDVQQYGQQLGNDSSRRLCPNLHDIALKYSLRY